MYSVSGRENDRGEAHDIFRAVGVNEVSASEFLGHSYLPQIILPPMACHKRGSTAMRGRKKRAKNSQVLPVAPQASRQFLSAKTVHDGGVGCLGVRQKKEKGASFCEKITRS